MSHSASTADRSRPQSFPGRYQVAVYGMLPEAPAPLVNQSRDDVQLVRAAVEGARHHRYHPLPAGRARRPLDCTDELQRVAGAPSLERITVPAGSTFAGCQLLRVTTAAKTAALPAALGIGFYAADTTGGQFSANLGRLVPTTELKTVGNAELKSGAARRAPRVRGARQLQVGPGHQRRQAAQAVHGLRRRAAAHPLPQLGSDRGQLRARGPDRQLDRGAEVLR